jgi:hypothetical protein
MPSKDPQDPTWGYVLQALAIGAARARENGYTWKGDSCYIVSAIALYAVMLTRRGEKLASGEYLIRTANINDPALAYADHYLHMRGEMARSGPGPGGIMRTFQETKTRGYDTVKRAVIAGRALAVPSMSVPADLLDRALRESDQPLSVPTSDSLFWGNEGIKDGIVDFHLNPGIDNRPAWLSKFK